MRMAKVYKEKNKFLRYFNETFKLSTGIERFVVTVLSLLILCHINTCLWYLTATLEADPGETSWI